MKHITTFSITLLQSGDQLAAEVTHEGTDCYATMIVSPHLSGNTAVSEGTMRHFGTKEFASRIGDELRARLERMEIALT